MEGTARLDMAVRWVERWGWNLEGGQRNYKKKLLGVRIELTTSGFDDHLITHMGYETCALTN